MTIIISNNNRVVNTRLKMYLAPILDGEVLSMANMVNSWSSMIFSYRFFIALFLLIVGGCSENSYNRSHSSNGIEAKNVPTAQFLGISTPAKETDIHYVENIDRNVTGNFSDIYVYTNGRADGGTVFNRTQDNLLRGAVANCIGFCQTAYVFKNGCGVAVTGSQGGRNTAFIVVNARQQPTGMEAMSVPVPTTAVERSQKSKDHSSLVEHLLTEATKKCSAKGMENCHMEVAICNYDNYTDLLDIYWKR